MKRYLLIIFLTITIISLISCRSRELPSGALDANPTPAATPNTVTMQLVIQDGGNPAGLVGVRLHYPKNYDRYEEGTTDDAGVVTITAYATGIFDIEILPDVLHGYLNSLFYQIEIKEGQSYAQKIIDRGTPSLLISIDPETLPSYGIQGTLVKYKITYSCGASKKYNLAVDGLGNTFNNNGLIYFFDKNFVENNGDTATLYIQIPTFFDAASNPKQLTFTVQGINNYPNLRTLQQTITQLWYFDIYPVGDASFTKRYYPYIFKITSPSFYLIYDGFDINMFKIYVVTATSKAGYNGGSGSCVSYWYNPFQETTYSNVSITASYNETPFDNNNGYLVYYNKGDLIGPVSLQWIFNCSNYSKFANTNGAYIDIILTNGIFSFKKRFSVCGESSGCGCPNFPN